MQANEILLLAKGNAFEANEILLRTNKILLCANEILLETNGILLQAERNTCRDLELGLIFLMVFLCCEIQI